MSGVVNASERSSWSKPVACRLVLCEVFCLLPISDWSLLILPVSFYWSAKPNQAKVGVVKSQKMTRKALVSTAKTGSLHIHSRMGENYTASSDTRAEARHKFKTGPTIMRRCASCPSDLSLLQDLPIALLVSSPLFFPSLLLSTGGGKSYKYKACIIAAIVPVLLLLTWL